MTNETAELPELGSLPPHRLYRCDKCIDTIPVDRFLEEEIKERYYDRKGSVSHEEGAVLHLLHGPGAGSSEG